jgi:hypothetical protein
MLTLIEGIELEIISVEVELKSLTRYRHLFYETIESAG